MSSTRLTRQQIQLIVGNRPELIRAFELLDQSVSGDIPDALAQAQNTASRALALAGQALLYADREADEPMPTPPGGAAAAAPAAAVSFGTAEVDFGATAKDQASTALIAVPDVVPSTHVQAWIQGGQASSTADNGPDAHALAACLMTVTPTQVDTGGFVLTARCQERATGKFRLHWLWSN